LSVTVTRNVAEAVFPEASLAEQWTVVVPTGNVESEAGEHVTARLPPTESLAVGAGHETLVPDGFAVVTDLSPGTPLRTGSVVSRTMTLNEPADVLPAASLALHVTLVVPSGNVEPEAGPQVTTGEGSTESETPTVYVTTAPDGPAASATIVPGSVRLGSVESPTTTSNESLELLPLASVALQLTVVVPSANVDPDGGVHVTTGTPSTASLAVAPYVTTAPDPLVASAVMSAGTVRVGAVVSTTWTSNAALAGLPAASVAVQLTVDVPIANVEPEAGRQPNVGEGSTTSTADARYVTTAPAALVASAVMSFGTVIVGATESTTVTLNEPVVVSPPESVTEQLTLVVPIANVAPEAGVQVGLGSGLSSASVAPTT
jgi:hypothetical protein